MKRKSKVIFAIGFSCLLALPAAILMPKTAEAKAAETTKLNLVDCIHTIHDNNLEDVVSNDLFDYGLRHGALNIGDKSGIVPGCYTFDRTGSNELYIYSSENTKYQSFFDWGGARYNFSGYDGLIFKIVAKKDIKIDVSMTADNVAGHVDDCQLYYFVSSNYDEASRNWIGDSSLIKKIELCPSAGQYATKSDIAQTINLTAGQTFYWEYSWNWSDQRNIELGTSGFEFSIEKVLAVDNLPMSTMVTNFTNNSGSPVKSSLVSYSIAHGNPNDGFNPFTSIASNKLGTDGDNCIVENWRGRSVVNDGFAFLFNVNTYSKFTVNRELPGSDWVSDAYIFVSINGEEVLNKKIASQDASEFDFEINVKKDDVVIWAFVFEWGEAGKVDSGRNIAMDNGGGDIVKTMPQFTFTEIDHSSHTFNKEVVKDKYLASEATCTEPASYFKSCDCGEKGSETFTSGDPLGHDWGEDFEHDSTHHWHECTREGCDACTEKEEHDFDSFVEHKTLPTCTDKGIDVYECECGETSEVQVDELGHAWSEDFEHDATHHWHECTREGCDACTEKVAHTFDQEVVDDEYFSAPATCTEPAQYFKSCVCGEKGSETFASGDPLGHAWGEDFEHDSTHHWHECTREGCDACTEKEEHDFDSFVEHKTLPTCTEKGIDVYECECGATNEVQVDALGHHFDKVNGQAATCEADGYKGYFKCDRCNALAEDNQGLKPISDLATWKTGAGKINKIGHKYNFVDEVKPTKDADGVKAHYECPDCGDLFIKDANGNYVKTTLNDLIIKYQSSGCGGSIIAGSAVLCGLALAGAALIIAKRKKED